MLLHKKKWHQILYMFLKINQIPYILGRLKFDLIEKSQIDHQVNLVLNWPKKIKILHILYNLKKVMVIINH